MSHIAFQLPTIVSYLDNEHCLGRLLFFSQATAYGEDAAGVRAELLRIATRVLPELPLLALHRHRAAVDFQIREVAIEVPPPPTRLWSSPLSMRFHAVCWDHENQASIAYLPSLDIEVIARRPEELERQIVDHIRFALMRRKAIGCLRELIWLQRAESVTVQPVSELVEIPTARQVVQRRDTSPQKSVLRDVASQLTGSKLPPVFELGDVTGQLMEWLYGDTPRSVLLVGPSGVGKTAAVYRLAADGNHKGTRRRQIWLTSGARIVAGMSGLGMWQERCQSLSHEASATKAIIHLGNLMELLQVGQSEGNDVGVGEFLRPAIAQGELLAISECTPEELTLIERMSPGMLEAFVRMDIQEPSPEASKNILRQAVDVYGRNGDVGLDGTALATLDRLHRRYATYSAYPGRPLRFLKHLLADAAQGQTLTAADVTESFSRETGLPLHLLEDTVPLDLASTRDWFRQRVVGQEEAVEIVVDLLATVKADLARPGRPLASLMFIGPTGVGKTEMAKTLAEFLYQDRQRLTRIDMSEYADPSAIDRLIGIGGRGEGLLTSKVREQPFGVVLLDEFEKAHPRFFDLLLQVLGDGRLTDGAGRLADFRNSVIIMTSNLGTESFGRRAPGFGSDDAADSEAADHFTARAREFLRPEMFNRIDRIVTFLPLSRIVLQDIARRELELLRQRDGLRCRPLHIEFDTALPGWLVDCCYDPRYGARPLKRAIERHILARVAESSNVAQADRLLHVHVTPGPQSPRISVRQVSSVTRLSGTAALQGSRLDELAAADACIKLRRQAIRLQQCRGVQELRNNLYRLQRAQQRRQARTRRATPAAEVEQAATLAILEVLAARVDRVVVDAVALEDQMLGPWYLGHSPELSQIITNVENQSALLRQLLLELYARQCERPNCATLVVYGYNADWKHLLAQSYYEMAASRDFQIEVHEIVPYSEPPSATPDWIVLGDRDSKNAEQRRQANETKLLAKRAGSVTGPLPEPTAQAIGVAFCIQGPCSWLLFQPEEGLHIWQEGSSKRRCLVHVSQAAMPDYQPPFRIDRREGIANQPVRRVWNRLRKSIDDRQSRSKIFWSGDALEQTLATLIEQHLRDRAEDWIGS